MPPAAPSRIAPIPAFDSLPFSAEHTASRAAAAFILLLLVPALGMVVVPVGLVIAFAASEALDGIQHYPVTAVIVSAGLCAWITVLVVPAKRIIQRFGNRRRVRIASGRVTVTDTSLFGTSHWSAMLADFHGIAHHVRATLSGVRHELILVHPIQARSVLLYSAWTIAQPTIDRAAALFGVLQVPPHTLYYATRATAHRPSLTPIDALPEAQTA